MKNLNFFSVVNNIKGNAEICTPEKFEAIIGSHKVFNLMAQIQAEPDAEKRSMLKKQLPAFCFHAYFKDGKRCNKSAVPSGLYMIDLDHIETNLTMATYYKDLVRCREEELGIVFSHITPSGKGLRLVGICPEGMDVVASQQWLIKQLGITEYDGVVKDLARLSFAPTSSMVLYLNKERLFATHTVEVAVAAAEPEVSVAAEVTAVPAPTAVPAIAEECYNNIPYQMIVKALMRGRGIYSEPAVGSRNNTVYELARFMRYICDFDFELLCRIVPTFGLSAEECRSTIKSALSAPRVASTPKMVLNAIAACQKEMAGEGEAEEPMSYIDYVRPKGLPVLPPLLQALIDILPPEFRQHAIMSSLPILGTLTTYVRGYYLDHNVHSTSFLATVMAPQASGKSYTRRQIDALMKPIMESDKIARKIEREYLEKRKNAKNSKQQPEDPRVVIRMVPATISNAMLLKRMDCANGLHLFSFAEEIDTATRSNKAGAWAAKSDIMRMSFDNSLWGQDYMSESSYSGQVNIYYNMLTCGTPRSVMNHYRNPEDGLVSRTIFIQLDDMMGQSMPVFRNFTPEEQTMVDAETKRLYELKSDTEDGLVWYEAPLSLAALNVWLEERRMDYLETQEHPSIEIFKKRSAVIGFRAALVYMALCHGVENENCAKFAVWVASYVFANQMQLFGEALDKIDAEEIDRRENSTMTREGSNKTLFSELPETFTKKDIIALLAQKGEVKEDGTINTMISRWKEFIVKIPNTRSWRKLSAAA